MSVALFCGFKLLHVSLKDLPPSLSIAGFDQLWSKVGYGPSLWFWVELEPKQTNPMAFFPIGPLGCGSFKAVAENKHSGDLPGSEQWDKLSSCVLHKMPWFINFSMMLSFSLGHVTLAFDQLGAVEQRRGRDRVSVELCPQPYWNNSPPGLLSCITQLENSNLPGSR